MSLQFLPYPQGISRYIFRLPLYMQQVGLGWMLRAFPLLILTTQGRKTGMLRHAVVEYRRHGSKLYVISAWGNQPNWYQNLLANPEVTVQFNGRDWKANASRVKDSGEALRALYMFKRTSPLYDIILANMSSATTIDLRKLKAVSSEFTVIRLDLEAGQPPLNGLKATHSWIAPLVLIMGVAVLAWMVGTRLSDSET